MGVNENAAVPRAKAKARTQPAKRPDAIQRKGFWMYIGPTIRGVITNGTLYFGSRADAEAAAAAAISQRPVISALIVPDRTLARDRASINNPASALHALYVRAQRGE